MGWPKGKKRGPMSEEQKELRRKPRGPFSEEHKAKLRGPKSEETRKKMRGPRGPMSEEAKANKRGPRPHTRGPRLQCSGEKNSQFGKDHSGEKSGSFKGVDHPRNYHWTYNEKLREEVREQNNYTCQLCGKIWVEGRKQDTHHIYGPEDNKESCNVRKLIPLCHKCHMIVEPNFADYISQFELIVNQEYIISGT